MIVFGIYCNFLIALLIRLRTYRSNVFFSFYKAKVRSQKIGRVSEVLIAPDRHRVRHLSRPASNMKKKISVNLSVTVLLLATESLNSFFIK